ncbi:flagellar type III secretion system pore protein FliP [Magnetospira sp. QH-2]|uniref:flagellar type III secretion system pore protein FliP n=1 Tax=Magnetospira sp. (strain QH-2) TaxID=1288970 RepID=UPI0003E81677|nr:flagellar type III secretion system pore protein FliP [Magnetospira sp. QH-2]CCQ74113.1 Flagellar biosynthesis protein FliP [Magnetospira sp. QH-2]
MIRHFALGLPVLAIALTTTFDPAWAQSFNFDLGQGGGSATNRIVQLLVLITTLSVAPSLLLMVTSFTRIVIVLSLVKMAMGTQQTPPAQVLAALALFLTMFIMAPTFEQAWEAGIEPLINEDIEEVEALERAAQPFRDFMLKHTREEDLMLFMDMAKLSEEEVRELPPYRIVVPAFMISELRRAFEIGFLLFLPFLVIDMVVASVLMAMGMMMLPPIIVALPFKIIFFVLVDGWHILVGSLVRGFGIE